jgi:molecular chaperone HscB
VWLRHLVHRVAATPLEAKTLDRETGRIEPFPPGTDYFTALGLPRKLVIDLPDLERRYHELSRRFHPDFFQTAAPRERRISLENSALLNKAYRTLRDPLSRAEYLVKLESAAGSEISSQPPQALFEEILELNELLADYRLGDPEERGALEPQLDEKEREFRAEYEALLHRLTGDLFQRWDAGIDSGASTRSERDALVAEMSRILGQRAYLRRVLSQLEETLSTDE